MSEDKFEVPQEVLDKLPKPSGYRMLCVAPKVEEKTAGGIIKPTQVLQEENIVASVFRVIEMGDDCYTDKVRFPNGPWCQNNDYVILRPYSGTKIKIDGYNFRIINDDSVEAVTTYPAAILCK